MRRALPVLVLLLLSACSGGGGDDAPTPEDRRKAYVQQAEKICAASNDRVQALGTPTSVDAVPAAADEAVAIVRDTVERLAALTPPEADRASLQDKVLGPLRADVAVAESYAAQVKAAAAANDGAALLRLVQQRPQTSADLGFMRGYGLTQCASAADQRD